MASTKLMETSDGRRYWKISVSRGYGITPYTTRFYWPEGYSRRSAERELRKYIADFELRCSRGEVSTRAERKRREAEAQAELAKLKTVRQYAYGIFMPAKQQFISENTRSSYQSNLDLHILPAIGDMLLTDVTPAMLMKLLLDFRKEHSYASTIKVYNILNGLFEMALFDDSISVSPMRKVKRPKQKKDEKAITEADKALSADELNYVLDCVSNEPLQWQAFMFLAADTAARRGELCGLQRADIDLERGVVTFRHNLQYTKSKGIYDVAPKGGKFRSVDIGEDTIALLKEHREDQSARCVSKWVFSADGVDQPIFPTSPTRYFKSFGKRYGIPGYHPHLLRHTNASLSLTNGGDIKSIADRLGHADASTTLRMYAHANADSIRQAGQAARDALKRHKEAARQTNPDGKCG